MERKFGIINDKWISLTEGDRYQAIKIDSILYIETNSVEDGFTIALMSSYRYGNDGYSGLSIRYSKEEEKKYDEDRLYLKDLLFSERYK